MRFWPKAEVLRRSVVRYFNRPATQGRGEIARDPAGYVITARPCLFGFLSGKIEYVGPPWSPPKGFFAGLTPEQQKAALEYRGPENHGDPALARPADTTRLLDPPIDWATWQQYAAEHHRPGWSFCRFALRGYDGAISFMYGIVRGPFGVHCESMLLGNPMSREMPVWGITHLRGGFGCGLFMSMEAACAAAEIAARLALDWDRIDVDGEDRRPLAETLGRTHLAWVNANLMPAPFLAHHKNPKVPPMNVWCRDFTPESRPTKEQMS